MFGNSAPFSYAPRGFSPDDLYQHRRALQSHDDFKESSVQKNTSRPSGRSIYMQRKGYSEALSRQPDSFQVRVEHLLTSELDGQEVRTVNDCVEKLKKLDAKGRLWPQEMVMEVQGMYLVLSDIQTKTELESMPLSCVTQTKAVLESCAYNSLLAITVQERSRRLPQVYMFQCEETGAELIKNDLDKAVQRGGGDVDPRKEQSNRNDLEKIIGQQNPGGFLQPGPRPRLEERAPQSPPPLDSLPPPWTNRELDNMPPQRGYIPQEEPMQSPDFYEPPKMPDRAAEQLDAERNTEILNHVINDLESFMGAVMAAVSQASQLQKKDKKKKKSKKKKSPEVQLPPVEDYSGCLQKIKYGFNLLSELDGTLSNPSATDFVHIFFNNLGMLASHYPPDVPPSVVSPLLTEPAMKLLERVVSPEEDQLWRSLGDSWNIPRSRWPDSNVPSYIPEFYDGWKPPPPAQVPSQPPPFQNGPVSRSNSQHFSPRAHLSHPSPDEFNSPWGPSPPTHSSEPSLYPVMYDFSARNSRELSVMKGEVVQVMQKNKQWWLVRNSQNEEGNVPQKVLETLRGGKQMDDPPWDSRGSVNLAMNSSPAEVKAWLSYKGFSKITVSSLGVLNGQQLLGMSKEEIRMVCPEEAGKVFFQLQSVKSSIALASEPSGPYHGRY
ncbi:epidermal growth factor receptor kinase substrate 8-like protein 3b [Pholidichthys leucotaenia]